MPVWIAALRKLLSHEIVTLRWPVKFRKAGNILTVIVILCICLYMFLPAFHTLQHPTEQQKQFFIIPEEAIIFKSVRGPLIPVLIRSEATVEAVWPEHVSFKDWYDEKQLQDVMKSSLCTLLLSIPGMALFLLIKNPSVYHFFLYYFFFILLIFSISTLYFFRIKDID